MVNGGPNSNLSQTTKIRSLSCARVSVCMRACTRVYVMRSAIAAATECVSISETRRVDATLVSYGRWYLLHGVKVVTYVVVTLVSFSRAQRCRSHSHKS